MTTVTISLSWFVSLAVESTVPVVLPESISFSVSCPKVSDEIMGYNSEDLLGVNGMQRFNMLKRIPRIPGILVFIISFPTNTELP